MIRKLWIVVTVLFMVVTFVSKVNAQQLTSSAKLQDQGAGAQLRQEIAALEQQAKPLRAQLQQIEAQAKPIREQLSPIQKKIKDDREKLRVYLKSVKKAAKSTSK